MVCNAAVAEKVQMADTRHSVGQAKQSLPNTLKPDSKKIPLLFVPSPP